VGAQSLFPQRAPLPNVDILGAELRFHDPEERRNSNRWKFDDVIPGLPQIEICKIRRRGEYRLSDPSQKGLMASLANSGQKRRSRIGQGAF
jgi:hypothetical protein